MHQQRQPELVERLIAASVAQTRFRAEEARALFELIVPNDLKDGLAQLSRVVFVVDAETAAYPWELMTDGKEPLATRMGLVRQLQDRALSPAHPRDDGAAPPTSSAIPWSVRPTSS